MNAVATLRRWSWHVWRVLYCACHYSWCSSGRKRRVVLAQPHDHVGSCAETTVVSNSVLVTNFARCDYHWRCNTACGVTALEAQLHYSNALRSVGSSDGGDPQSRHVIMCPNQNHHVADGTFSNTYSTTRVLNKSDEDGSTFNEQKLSTKSRVEQEHWNIT